MKKIICLLLVGFVLMGCSNGADNTISLEEAQEIALKEVEGKVTQAKEEIDDGISYYEFTIITDDKKYEIVVNGETGSVISKEKDDDYVPSNNTDKNTNPPSSPNNQLAISAETAQQTALDRVGGGYLNKCELDEDNGMVKYEIEVKNGNKEYDIDVDANTGEIIKFEEEIDD